MTNEYKTLKDYVVAFQAGDDGVLWDLITQTAVKEQNEDGIYTDVTRLKFNDKFLNKLLSDMKFKYYQIPRLDTESWFLSCLVGDVLEQGLMYQIDTSKSPQQIVKYVALRIDGHIKNQIKKERLFDENVIQDAKGFDEDEGEIGSHFDSYAFSEWSEIEDYGTVYESFLEATEGLKKILTGKQYEVYTLRKSGLTQAEAGEKCNPPISQQAVDDHETKSIIRIRTAFLNFKMYDLLVKDSGKTYKKIKKFLEDYQNIVEFDEDQSFNYFGYVKCWIFKNRTSKDEIDYELLHKNRPLLSEGSIWEVLEDNIQGEASKVLNMLLQDGNAKLTNRQKERFVIGVLKSFSGYITKVENSVETINKQIVSRYEGKSKDYDDIANVFVE